MLNQSILVGRIVDITSNEESMQIKITVPRGFKNQDGEYENDNFYCITGANISKEVKEYCKAGDLIGIKGRLESLDGNNVKIVADRITFLTSGKE